MERISYSIDDIAKEIPSSTDGSGTNLSLTSVYDDIKNARIEEDDKLSFGIWERELKKANWELVEALTFEIIRDKSKDLQLVGWLIESLVILDGFKGIAKGMEILKTFLEFFWQSCYPKAEDETSDEEQKFRILNWIYESVNKRATLIPFIFHGQDEQINLYNHDYACELLATTKRSPASSSEIINSAKKENVKTLDEIQNMIKSSQTDDLKNTLYEIKNIYMSEESLMETIKKISKDNSIGAFYALKNNLSKIEKIIQPYLSGKNTTGDNEDCIKEATQIDNTSSNKRDDIYEQIGSLANTLKNIDKHSPSYYILNLVFSWKDKSLLEIITDLQSGETEAHKLLKILLNH